VSDVIIDITTYDIESNKIKEPDILKNLPKNALILFPLYSVTQFKG
jgi:hypothetical protein